MPLTYSSFNGQRQAIAKKFTAQTPVNQGLGAIAQALTLLLLTDGENF